MVGMLGLGLVLRNVPYIDYGKDLDPTWSAPIRQTALAVILTRAGLGLDPKILLAFKGLILRFAFFPTVLEAVAVAILANLILQMPWAWALLLG
jgi:NhaP-type Na+/H+ or K+/H+ antiporter